MFHILLGRWGSTSRATADITGRLDRPLSDEFNIPGGKMFNKLPMKLVWVALGVACFGMAIASGAGAETATEANDPDTPLIGLIVGLAAIFAVVGSFIIGAYRAHGGRKFEAEIAAYGRDAPTKAQHP